MNNPNTQYYDPATAVEGREGGGVVLKPKAFKPLMNRKTGNFFSYSFGLVNRENSPNSLGNITWVQSAPAEMQEKIDVIRTMHREQEVLHEKLVRAMKDEDRGGVRRCRAAIIEQTLAIDEAIYPDSEREYVESKEAKRFRLEQQNELTLDAGSIAALRGDAPGSTADASIAQAKLDIAEAKIKALEEAAQSAKMAKDKPAPARPKASAPKPR